MLANQVFLFNLDPQLLFDVGLMLIAVFVLFLFMSKLLFNPARKMMQERQQRIQDDINNAEKDKADAQALKVEYEAKLKNVEKEADAILSETRQKALSNESKIVDEAKQEASRIIKRAQDEAELEKKHAMDDMKQEVVQIASLMAAKVVAANIDTNIQDSLVDETLREMGDSTWQN